MPADALPEHLRYRKHEDYPPFLRWIPRAWTAWSWGKPVLVGGNVITGPYPAPITHPGTWQLSHFPDGPCYAWYFALTTRAGFHFRIGARWDDVDGYVEWPSIAIKRGVL